MPSYSSIRNDGAHMCLTHLHLMEFPNLINLTSPFQFKGFQVELSFLSNHNRTLGFNGLRQLPILPLFLPM